MPVDDDIAVELKKASRAYDAAREKKSISRQVMKLLEEIQLTDLDDPTSIPTDIRTGEPFTDEERIAICTRARTRLLANNL